MIVADVTVPARFDMSTGKCACNRTILRRMRNVLLIAFLERKLLARPAAMPQYVFPMNLYATRTYERVIRKLLSEDARRDMEAAIVTAPDVAPVIRGTGGIRKLRWAGSGRGKRGGIRAIYFWHAGAGGGIHADRLREG